MRDRQASRESSTEPDAIRSIFLLDIVVGEPLEELTALPAADPELIDGADEGFISSLAQPAVSRAINAIIPAILAVPGLLAYSSVPVSSLPSPLLSCVRTCTLAEYHLEMKIPPDSNEGFFTCSCSHVQSYWPLFS